MRPQTTTGYASRDGGIGDADAMSAAQAHGPARLLRRAPSAERRAAFAAFFARFAARLATFSGAAMS